MKFDTNEKQRKIIISENKSWPPGLILGVNIMIAIPASLFTSTIRNFQIMDMAEKDGRQGRCFSFVWLPISK